MVVLRCLVVLRCVALRCVAMPWVGLGCGVSCLVNFQGTLNMNVHLHTTVHCNDKVNAAVT